MPEPADLRPPPPASRAETWFVVVCLAATALMFLPALEVPFVYDDRSIVLENASLRSWDGLTGALTRHFWAFDANSEAETKYYRPLMTLALFACYQAFGEEPTGYHVVSIALHVLAGLLLHRLAVRLRFERAARLAALAVFTLHPLQIQTVVWVSAMSDLLVAVLSLFALLCCARFGSSGRMRDSIVAALAYLAAMLVLDRAIALLVSLLLAVWFGPELEARPVDERSAKQERVLRAAVVLALPLAVVLVLRRVILGSAVTSSEHWLADTVLTAPSILLRYLRNLAWPGELALTYPEHFLSSASDPAFWAPLAFCILLSSLVSWLSLGRPRRLLSLGIAASALAPSLAVGLLPGQALVQDRYAYLPLAFVSLWLADLVFDAFRPRRALVAARVLWLSWLLVLCGLHGRNLAPWQQSEALFARAVAVAPDNPQMIMNLALLRQAKGAADDGCAELARAASILERDPRRGEQALVSHNLGNCLRAHGRLAEALVAFDRAFVASSGGLIEAGANRVVVLQELGRVQDAQRAAVELATLHSASSAAWKLAGLAHANAGDLEAAEQALLRSLALDPRDSTAAAVLQKVQAARAR